jgi:hypothetical protein
MCLRRNTRRHTRSLQTVLVCSLSMGLCAGGKVRAETLHSVGALK